MTKPSITFGHGTQIDCIDSEVDAWNATEARTNMAEGDCALTGLYDDYFRITATADSSSDEYCCYYKDLSSLALSTTLYTKFKIRWRTSVGSNGFGAKAIVSFTSGEQTILGPSAPQFSIFWIVTSGTLTTGKTIDKLYLYADDYPNSVASGTFTVDFDYIFFYKNDFTVPNTQFGKRWIPPPRNAIIEIPGRVGDITQNLGSHSARFECSCNLDRGTWKRLIANGYDADDYVKGQVFEEISHNSFQNAWNWLNTGMGRQLKVVLDDEPVFSETADTHSLDLVFREYRRSGGQNEDTIERFGLNL